MNFTYFLYLITFLGFPTLAYTVHRYIHVERFVKYLKFVALLFLVHNVFYYFDYSFRGDYVDYIIFSLEYFYFSYLVLSLSKSKIGMYKVLNFFGSLILIIGFVQGVIGILLFTVISQDLEADKVIESSSLNKTYESRRYSFGFATLIDTRYTFETYRQFQLSPFEEKINEIDLFSLKSDLDFEDKNFKVDLKLINNKQFIEFSSPNNQKKELIKIVF